jgi:hypothetical protein
MRVGSPVDEEVLVSTTTAPLRMPTLLGRHERRIERRRLKRLDALSAQLAELFSIRTLLVQAAEIVGDGWVQGAWFTVSTPQGGRAITGFDLRLARTRPVTGACLVGSVVQAAGGPGTERSQRVQRTLDLTWHALRDDAEQPVRWCPGPEVRMMQVLELTHWNDAPERTQDEVVNLLVAAQRTTTVQSDLCRAEQARLATADAAQQARSAT